MSDDRPSARILAAWADVSARSKARPIVRPERAHVGRPMTAGGGLAAVVAVAIVAGGFLAVVSVRNDRETTASPSAPGASSMAAAATPSLVTPSSPSGTLRPTSDLRAGQLLTAVDGWAITSVDLLVTHDGGQSWSLAANPAPDERLVGAAFADALHGWVVTDRVPAEGSSGTLRVDVHRTDDGGVTWETSELLSVRSPGPDPLVGFPTFSVVSREIAYVELFAEGAADSEFRLFATLDGGRSWAQRSRIPLWSIAFVDPSRGWAVRQDTNALMRTVDGGRSWAGQVLPAIPGFRAADLYPSVPKLLADGSLVLFEQTAKDGGRGVFLQSVDDGATWTIAARGPIEGGDAAAFLDDRTWLLQTGSGLLASNNAGATWETIETGLPGVIDSITVVDPRNLSAIVGIFSNCPPNADCYIPLELWISRDGGRTWVEATP
ncbi:MAG TPA: hypothetical protein VGQ64_11815 [Candidatus Limnocylindrales bacterium]|nr:hypothetical protein [Candidatus Limnocylindrales bacterium]